MSLKAKKITRIQPPKLAADAATDNAEAIEFHEFPKALHHPDFEPDAPGQLDSLGCEIGPRKPAKFPPRTVHSLDEEEAALALGYRATGRSDAVAYRAELAAPGAADLVPDEFPKLICCHCAHCAVERSHDRPSPHDRLVRSFKEEIALMGPVEREAALAKRAAARPMRDDYAIDAEFENALIRWGAARAQSGGDLRCP
jgi:hypothetical protein